MNFSMLPLVTWVYQSARVACRATSVRSNRRYRVGKLRGLRTVSQARRAMTGGALLGEDRLPIRRAGGHQRENRTVGSLGLLLRNGHLLGARRWGDILGQRAGRQEQRG